MVARLSMLRRTARLPMDAAIALDMWSDLPLSTTTGLCALSSVSSCDTCASSARRFCRSASTASFALDASESAAESPLSAGRAAISAVRRSRDRGPCSGGERRDLVRKTSLETICLHTHTQHTRHAPDNTFITN